MSKIKVKNYRQAFDATGEFLEQRFGALQIGIASAHDKLASLGGRVTRLEREREETKDRLDAHWRHITTFTERPAATPGDPGNYLHRLNQVEQDIRELRIAIHGNEQQAASFAMTLGQTIAELQKRNEQIGAHDNS